MVNLSPIARPYALAAFEYARENQQLSAWKVFLEAAADVIQQPSVKQCLARYELSSAKLFELLQQVLAAFLNAERKNFLLLLEQNQRLPVLPAIAEQFNDYYTALEKVSHVRVITAVEAEKDFKEKLSRALTKRIQHEVTLQCEIDPSLIGGAVIHISDRVIDGSVRGKLTRLLHDLTE